MTRRLPRRAPKRMNDQQRLGLLAARRRWRTVALWLMGIGAVAGTSLRRPLRGDYGMDDLLWAALFAAVTLPLALIYRVWQRRAEAESTQLLAKVSKDTLLVFPRPGLEQRVPLIGVGELVLGEVSEHEVELKTIQPAAMGGSYRVSLSVEEADEVIAFVNALLADHAWHQL